MLLQVSSYLNLHNIYNTLSGYCFAFGNVNSRLPQGSVVRPILVSIYSKLLSTIIDSHSIMHHSFANDSQL